MTEYDDVDEAIRAAFDLVKADASIVVTEHPQQLPDGDTQFRCSVPVLPHPNPENLPERARLRVILDNGFPLRPVKIFAEDAEVQGFPHQDAETGKLCLFPDGNAPFDPRRLKVFIDWAREWLKDAATGNLLRPGHPYELPDFSRRNFKDKLATDHPLLSDEDSESFAVWKDRVGQMGRVELVSSQVIRGFLIRSFQDAAGNQIRERNYSKYIADPVRKLTGRWILLPTLTFFRHRPPQTMAELKSLCQRYEINLLDTFRKAWEEENQDPQLTFVLIGCPIPFRVEGEPVEIHWQPLFMPGIKDQSRRYEAWLNERHKNRRGRIRSSVVWDWLLGQGTFAANTPLPWGKTENISRQRLYARGGQTAIAAHQRVVLAGCGALGSVTGELIARGGVPDLTFFDADKFEFGNQCRHTLDGSDLGLNKATALARRLQLSNPLSSIKGFATHLPLLIADPIQEIEKLAADSLDNAKLLIDCTTDEGAFRWLNLIATQTGARLVSLFVNFRAEILTMCISGGAISCRDVSQKLYRDILYERTPVKSEAYYASPPKDELVFPGAGCWHPTFPATNSQLWMLAAAAVEVLNAALASPIRSYGSGILIQRKTELDKDMKSIIEIIWHRRYR